MKWNVLLPVLFFLVFACKSGRKVAGNEPRPVARDTVAVPVKKEKQENMTKTDPFLEKLFRSQTGTFRQIINHHDDYRVQVIYTQINRDSANFPSFHTYYYNVNPNKYFYPASTVKMPVALLALQRLNELKVFGLNTSATMITEASYSGQTPAYNDPTSADGRPSIANYIKKIFLVSDNEAYNRLYEFLGQEYINSQLQRMGFTDAQILHRLEIFLSEDENRHTNPIKFFTEDGRPVYQQPMQFNQQAYTQRNDFLGKRYYSGEKLVKDPMNFSKKNKIPLEDLHNILCRVIFPEAFPENLRFNLKPEDYRLVWKFMSQLPSETIYPTLDTSAIHDTYAKFLYFGNDQLKFPPTLRIFNKIGDAYGCMTDIAYFVDFEKNIEFMLSATIYCNEDGVMNDDKYDYDTVGYPFMKQLGRLIYEYELTREKDRKPDLSKFRMVYDR